MDDKLLTPEQAAALLNLKANIPPLFLSSLREEHPELLDPWWQRERIHQIREVYREKRVIIGQEGFTSLAHPHDIVKQVP